MNIVKRALVPKQETHKFRKTKKKKRMRSRNALQIIAQHPYIAIQVYTRKGPSM